MPDWPLLLELAAGLIATGLVAGLIAGLLGVGGGIVIVPVLVEALAVLEVPEDVRMHVAVGTSLASVLATSLFSARTHHEKGALDMELLGQWGPWILLGAIAGAAVAGQVSGAVLTAVFAALALAIALYMAFVPPDLTLRPAPPRGLPRVAAGGLIGGLSAMMGIGGGSFVVPAFSACGVAMHRAVGTAAALGFVIAWPGSLGYIITGWGDEALPNLSMGFVNLLGLLVIAPATAITAPLGARLAHRLPARILRRAFALFLVISAARLLSRLF